MYIYCFQHSFRVQSLPYCGDRICQCLQCLHPLSSTNSIYSSKSLSQSCILHHFISITTLLDYLDVRVQVTPDAWAKVEELLPAMDAKDRKGVNSLYSSSNTRPPYSNLSADHCIISLVSMVLETFDKPIILKYMSSVSRSSAVYNCISNRHHKVDKSWDSGSSCCLCCHCTLFPLFLVLPLTPEYIE